VRVGYLDCASGISGDMFLGALVDAGWGEEGLRQAFQHLPVTPEQIIVEEVHKAGIRATQVRFNVEHVAPVRHLHDLQRLLAEAHLAPHVAERAGMMFLRLAEVEASIHGIPVEHVLFHELSGLDTLLDVVGAAQGMDALGLDHLYVSPLNVGSGVVRTEHGLLPVPAPATAALLEGFIVYGRGEPGERVTPTGAVIAATLGEASATLPSMRLVGSGYGAGQKEFDAANVVRLLIGETSCTTAADYLTVLDCSIDDMNPEIQPFVIERLLQTGALDAFMTPIVMKKGRLATLLSVLCKPEQVAEVRDVIFCETSTLGVRQYMVERHALPRSWRTVQTTFGPIRMKLADRPGGWQTGAAEFEDCRVAAEAFHVPLQRVYEAAQNAISHHT